MVDFQNKTTNTEQERKMIFNSFKSQEERRKFGGNYFIEIQFCKLPEDTPSKNIVDVMNIKHWKNDSLYISGDNDSLFLTEYGKIITGGIYNNQKTGPMDLLGINYYCPETTKKIIEELKTIKPLESETLVKWLEESLKHNGFYVLGL